MATNVDDLTGMVGSTLGRFAREATHAVSHNGRGSSFGFSRNGGDHHNATRGVVAGVALAAAAPLVGKAVKGAVTKRVGSLKDDVGEAVGKKVDQATNVPEVAKQAGKQMIPGLGGDEDEEGGGSQQQKKGVPGVGKGRRMPIQQAIDVAVPVQVAYDQWTQFEEWPQFMHRLDQVTQEDDCTVSFKTKLWGMSKEFVAEIAEQRPDERIQWKVTKGVTHSGVVTFHELAPRLTRVQVSLDVEPGSLIEKAARGMRHVKRAVRADMARFKAFVEMEESASGGWRGTIHDGEVVEQHSDSGSGSGSGDRDDADSSAGEQGNGGGGKAAARSTSRARPARRASAQQRAKPAAKAKARSSRQRGRTGGSGSSSRSGGRTKSRSGSKSKAGSS